MRNPKSRRYEGRAAFIAQLGAIRSEVESGFSLKSIYDGRKAALGIGYRYFHQLVARHIGFARDRFSNRPIASPVPPPSSVPQTRTTTRADPKPVQHASATENTGRTPKENNDGPKAPPRPRSFVRLSGLPDDNKDYLIGPPDDSHDAAAQGRRR
jgi:hypothetical protein